MNYAWTGFSPAEFRLVNIVIHIGAGLLLYGVIRRTLLLPRWNARFDASATSLALATALLWILHPLQTESVTYIAQRIEALMGFFYLLTFYGFIRASSSNHPRAWWSTAAIACALGMGTKEVMITAPVLLFLYDGIFMASSWRDLFCNRWKRHTPFFATWIIFLVLMGLGAMQETEEQAVLFTTDPVRWDYALTQLNILVHYLKLSLVPHPLCLDYRWPLVNSPLEALWPGVLTLLLGAGTMWALYRRNWIGFIGAWFFIILAPTSSFNPLPDAAFEHRMYLPLAGILAFVVVSVHQRFGINRGNAGRPLSQWMGLTLLVSVALIFGILTSVRNTTYRSEEAMWRDVLLKRPDNYRTAIALSTALVNQQRYGEAEALCTDLLARLPNLSQLSPEAIKKQYARPGRPPVHLYFSMAHNNLGLVALNRNRPEAAERHFREAIRVMPGAAWAYINLGQVFHTENRLDDAIAEWRKALELQPLDSQAQGLIGVALLQNKQYREAADHFALAIRANPGFWFARAQLAWMLATCPSNEVRNGQRAVEIAQPLLEGSGGQSPRALDILAAAYAETGDYSNAVKTAEQAFMLATRMAGTNSTPSSVSPGDILQRLNGYKAGQPCRSE